MIRKITGEAPFQVLASNFSIGPSQQGYTLQISADGRNYSNLFSVAANTTRMVTGVANGSFYRLAGNNSEVSINWITQCSDGGGGSTPTPVDPVDPTLLKSSQEVPAGAEMGDVYAMPSGTKDVSYDDINITRYLWSNYALYNAARMNQITDMVATVSGGNFSFKYYRTGVNEGDEMLQYIVDGQVVSEHNLTTENLHNKTVFVDASRPGVGFYIQKGLGNYSTIAKVIRLYVPTTYGEAEITYTHGENWSADPASTSNETTVSPTYTITDYSVFQVNGYEEILYATITGEGDYSDYIESEGMFYPNTGKMIVTLNDPSNANPFHFGFLSQESNNYKFDYVAADNRFDIYDAEGSEVMFVIDAGSNSAGTHTFDNDEISWEFDGTVLTLQSTYGGGGFGDWVNSVIGYKNGSERLVKESEIEGKLMPEAGSNGDMAIYSDGWVASQRSSVIYDGIREAFGYDESAGNSQVLVRTGDYDIEWQQQGLVHPMASAETPKNAEDGAAWAYADNGEFGMRQVQGEDGVEWKSSTELNGNEQPTKFRMSTASSYAVVTYDIGECTGNDVTWAEGAWKSSIELTDAGGGVYTGTSDCGWNITLTEDTDYIYIEFDEAVDSFYGEEFEAEVAAKKIANIVTSTDIKRMVKIEQSAYDSLVSGGTVDETTFYIIVPDSQ